VGDVGGLFLSSRDSPTSGLGQYPKEQNR